MLNAPIRFESGIENAIFKRWLNMMVIMIVHVEVEESSQNKIQSVPELVDVETCLPDF